MKKKLPILYRCDPDRAIHCRKSRCMYRPEVRQKDCGWTFLPECAAQDRAGNCIAALYQLPKRLSSDELSSLERRIEQERERYRRAAKNHKEVVK